MKRIYVLLLAMALALTGCAGKGKPKNISVQDAVYPYEIQHKKGVVTITLHDNTDTDITWQTEMLLGDICQVTQADANEEGTICYDVTGIAEGSEQLTITAQQADETVCFTLSMMIDVNAKGKAAVQSSQHKERKQVAAEENGLSYKWRVNLDGTLTFSLADEEDTWNLSGDGEGVCVLENVMHTPSGFQFSAQATGEGQTSVLLEGESTQRKLCVTLQADSDGKLEVTSVQEQ